MATFSFLGVKDVHITHKTPRSRKDSYYDAIFNKLSFVQSLCDKYKADGLLDAGDLLDKKNPADTPHNVVRRTIELVKGFSCPWYGIYGNHEMPLLNMKDARERHPKSVLFESGVINHVPEEGIVLVKDGVQVRIVGADYDHYENDREVPWFARVRRDKSDDFVICLAHCFAGPTGGILQGGERRWSYKEIARAGAADVYFFGHEHIDQGIVEVDGKFFVNNGSLSRGVLNEDNVARDVNVPLIEIDKSGVTVKLLRVECPPSDEIYSFAEASVLPGESETINFIEKLIASKPIDLELLIDEAPHSKTAKKAVKGYLSL